MTEPRVLNLRPDRPDRRDIRFAAMAPSLVHALPSVISLRGLMPQVYDQGKTSSCTGHAIAGLLHFQEIKEGRTVELIPSRLFIYYNERLIEGTTDEDSGAMIRDGFKALVTYGYCFEDTWAFVPWMLKIRPSAKAYMTATRHKVQRYMRVEQTLASLKQRLADGHPVVTGITLYERFESKEVAKTGRGALPVAGEKVVGGHAVLIVGYNDQNQTFELRNSWGAHWGDGGYFTLPYAYVLNPKLAQDFWTVTFVP